MHYEALTKQGAALFPRLSAFPDFYLAGGTALALQIGHRVSVDFDFFSSDPIPHSLLLKAKRVFEASSVEPLINNPDELTVLVDDMKLTFLAYPFPVIAPLVSAGGLHLLSVTEIAATKAYSIGRRGTYKDYVDLYAIVKHRHATLAEIIAMAERKFEAQFNSRLFAEQLLFMDDIGDYRIEFLGAPTTPTKILTFFKAELRRLPADTDHRFRGA
jgi:Nucleotidyl transferase AbiEii toxin, Type IV TA system